MPQHATRTSFKPGQSGNPSGYNGGGHRPVIPAEVLEAARAQSLPAIEVLTRWMHSTDARASIAASIALLDRAWGRPEQSMHMAGSLDVAAQRAEEEQMVEAMKRLDISELRMLIGFYRKAGLKLPGEQ